jgi:GT2 family glycosyltransferase
LGVVVLTYGDEREANPLLESLIGGDHPVDHVLLVHNDSGSDHACDHAAVDVIHPGTNTGYSGGMNAGIKRLLEQPCELILLLTHDVRLRPGCIDRLRSAAVDDYGILGPELRARDSGAPFSHGGVSGPRGETRHRRECPAGSEGHVSECDWLDGAVLLLRREVLETVGLLEEKYFMYWEDAELCLRVRAAGWRVGCVLGAVAEERSGRQIRPATHSYLMTRNRLDYQRKVAGAVGIGAGLRKAARTWWRSRRRAALAATKADSRVHAARARAVRAGVYAWARGHWGPPPEWARQLDAAVAATPVE